MHYVKNLLIWKYKQTLYFYLFVYMPTISNIGPIGIMVIDSNC